MRSDLVVEVVNRHCQRSLKPLLVQAVLEHD